MQERDDVLTLKEAADLRSGRYIQDNSDRSLSELRQHGREVYKALERFKTLAAQQGVTLEQLLDL